MKPPKSISSSVSVSSLLAGVASCLLLGHMPSYGAQIVAKFEGGGSNTSSVTNQVDAFRGKAGDGWTSAWTIRNDYGSGSMGSIAVVNDGTLWSGNRLKLTPSNNATGTGFGVYRSYGAYEDISITNPFTISFQVSIDNLETFLNTVRNEIFIGENSSTSMNRTSTTSWYVQAFGGTDPDAHLTRVGYETGKQMQWNLGNGADLLPTGITLRTGVLYSFTIQLNPAEFKYSVQLSDGTDTFKSGVLAFRSEETLGRNLAFGQLYAATEGAGFSFGNVMIVPEPGTYGLLGLGALAFGLGSCRRRILSRYADAKL